MESSIWTEFESKLLYLYVYNYWTGY